jgi:dephospho-CoA kinase
MKKPEVILVFGRICSGKSTFQSQSYRIVVSNIVRDLMQTDDRSVLQNSLNLDERIAEEIVGCIDALTTAIERELIVDKPIIVDGIRQSSIVDYVLQWYPESEMVWLDVPENKRKQRYEARKDGKDTEAFEIADNKPIELECQKIYETFKDKLQIIHNH